jgi:hypothetical protein
MRWQAGKRARYQVFRFGIGLANPCGFRGAITSAIHL